MGPKFAPVSGDETTPLKYEEVEAALDKGMDWLAHLYADTMNIIHYMHDKYNYERVEMALHDTYVRRQAPNKPDLWFHFIQTCVMVLVS